MMYPPRTILWCYTFVILLVTLDSRIITRRINSLNLKNEAKFYQDVFYVEHLPIFEYVCLLVSLPFLLLTFVVYSILPELQNMHGYALRVHIALLFVTNVIKFCTNEFPILTTGNYCVLLAYIFNFSFLSSLFWLNVICFDIWWTLRQFRSYGTILKKREKKKFIIYSIYACGISLILNVVCAILDIPSISKHLIPPGMCKKKFWFSYSTFPAFNHQHLLAYNAKNSVSDEGMKIYFYIPVSVAVIVNICFFIATTLRIRYYNKQTADQLRDSRSSRHNKNKFTIYLKLFIVMGISWAVEIILWWAEDVDQEKDSDSNKNFHQIKSFELNDKYISNIHSLPEFALWHIAKTIDTLQGLIIFFAFVWKKKIKLLLLKRFGWQDFGWRDFANISRNNYRPSISSNTISLTSISGIVSMQEISLSNQQINHRLESYS